MFCPICGHEQISREVRFCAKCGFPLSGVSLLIARGGKLYDEKRKSSRRKGIKQGIFIFLLTFLVVPIVAILSDFLSVLEIFVPISAVLFFVGGILRMIYALMFEGDDYSDFENKSTTVFGEALSSSEKLRLSEGVQDYQLGTEKFSSRQLEELPISVTEETTMLFEERPLPREKIHHLKDEEG